MHNSYSLTKNESIVAWNEDTVNSYLFLLTKKRFYYKILSPDSNNKRQQDFNGKYSFSRDTVFLRYKGKSKPLYLDNYLIVEGSVSYLIQTFKTSNKRIFLRIKKNRLLY